MLATSPYRKDRSSQGSHPRVSVVAPSYQRRHDLPRFIDSVLGQSDLHELVVAVDGSRDGSVEWLQKRRLLDQRLTVLDLPNRGAGPARRSGIEAATGETSCYSTMTSLRRPEWCRATAGTTTSWSPSW